MKISYQGCQAIERLLVWLFVHCLLLLSSLPAYAHVGSAGVVVQKQVGKYRLLIQVNPPDVVPGTANVIVFVEQGRVRSIGARPIYFLSGDKGAPTHDRLTITENNRYEGDLWLMDAGSSSIELNLDGPDGKEQIIVPIVAVATALRDMPVGTGWGLAALGLLLVVMMVTIIGASNADGIVLPTQMASTNVKRRRWVGMSVGLVIMTLILVGWRSWWTSSTEEYRTVQLYKPLPIHTNVGEVDKQRRLTIRFDTVGFGATSRMPRLFSYLLPDHGKLMHAFLVRTPGLDAFAHIHPNRQDSLTYQSTLPDLPGGRYLLYADIVYRSGFTETLTDTIDIPTPQNGQAISTAAHPSDPDDSWMLAEPLGLKTKTDDVLRLDKDMSVCGKPSASVKLADGSTMIWMDKPTQVLEAGKPYTLKFAVADGQGKAAAIEPYLGMGGHAAIVRSDGTVYVHLHPVGTYSMAAEGSLVNRLADTAITFHFPDANRFRDSIDTYLASLRRLPEGERNRLLKASMPAMRHEASDLAEGTANMVEFPYAFPRAGQYRIWVQVKRNGRVLTGVFDTLVNEPLF